MVTKTRSADAALIEGWLHELRSEPRRAIDPAANWRFEIEYPPKSSHRLSVVNPKQPARAVVIVTGMHLAPLHIAAWEGLDPDEKKDFIFDLQEALIRDYVEFQLQGVNDPSALSCPTGVQLMAVIFDDGLSLDALAQRMGCMLRAEAAAGLCINRYLGPGAGTSGSGQFEFRRLGSIQ